LLLCWRTGHRPGALLAAAGPVLSVVCAEILKRVVLRTEGGALGFPSGLSAGVTAEAGCFAVLLCGRHSRRRLRRTTRGRLWIVAFVCWAGLNCVVVVTRYHYVTDVVGSCLLAVVVVIAAAYGLDQVRLASWQTDGSAPDPLDPRSTR
jgi:membrane-associated phospholipid phosphatase